MNQPTEIELRQMTKTQLIYLGGKRFIYTKRGTWIGAFVFSLAFLFVMYRFYEHTTTTNVLSIVPLVVVLISFLYTWNKAGNKFWKEVQDKKNVQR